VSCRRIFLGILKAGVPIPSPFDASARRTSIVRQADNRLSLSNGLFPGNAA
jgi:hypothetical protein